MVAKGGGKGGGHVRGGGGSVGGLTSWEEVGIAVGSVVGICILAVIAWCYYLHLSTRRSKRRPLNPQFVTPNPTAQQKRPWWKLKQRQRHEQDVELLAPPPYEGHVLQPERARLSP